MTQQPASYYVRAVEGPIVEVPARIAAILVDRAGLADYHRTNRGVDAELDAVLVALKTGSAVWKAGVRGSDRGTSVAKSSEPMEEFITVRSAANRLQIGPRAICKAIRAKRIDADFIDGRWQIDPISLQHYAASRGRGRRKG
jgi:hypothetical protein